MLVARPKGICRAGGREGENGRQDNEEDVDRSECDGMRSVEEKRDFQVAVELSRQEGGRRPTRAFTKAVAGE